MAHLTDRRTIGSDADAQRVWASAERYACDRCQNPKSLPAPPMPLPERK